MLRYISISISYEHITQPLETDAGWCVQTGNQDILEALFIISASLGCVFSPQTAVPQALCECSN